MFAQEYFHITQYNSLISRFQDFDVTNEVKESYRKSFSRLWWSPVARKCAISGARPRPLAATNRLGRHLTQNRRRWTPISPPTLLLRRTLTLRRHSLTRRRRNSILRHRNFTRRHRSLTRRRRASTCRRPDIPARLSDFRWRRSILSNKTTTLLTTGTLSRQSQTSKSPLKIVVSISISNGLFETQ